MKMVPILRDGILIKANAQNALYTLTSALLA